MTRSEYFRLRAPTLLAKGIDPDAVEYLLDLERADRDATASCLAELSRVPAWEGRRVRLARGGALVFLSGRWILEG